MDKENIKIDQQQYCRKVRFYPGTKHKLLLEQCFRGTRYLINKALEQIKDGKIKNITNPISIRNHLRYQNKYLSKKEKWLENIPYDTRDGAIRQLSSNFKTAFTQLEKKEISKFCMKYKSKKNPIQVCFINKDAFNLKNKTLFVNKIKEPIIFKENIDDFEFGNSTIVREKNRYYMCFSLKRDIVNVETQYKSVALDPGVHTFQSFYSEEGIIGKLGDETTEDIKRIYKKEDKLKSKLATMKFSKRTRYNIRKRCFLLRTKVKNKVEQLHRMCCSWLTSTFKYIFLPSFNVKDMIRKKINNGRKISKTTVRSMLALSHFSFKKKLLHMASSKGCMVDICKEDYTSKTCGCCGNIKHTLGGQRVYNCSNCGISIDRDYNGARNIYLRNTQ
jgi:putative transposase